MRYDVAVVGASIICSIEAVFRRLSGKRVIIVDSADQIGGAWSPLSIFGLTNVENAVHYILPDSDGVAFLQEYLGCRIRRSQGKTRVFRFGTARSVCLPYDGRLSRMMAAYQEAYKGATVGVDRTCRPSLRAYVRGIYSAVGRLAEAPRPSNYLEGGAAEVIGRVKELLQQADVPVHLSTEVRSIRIDGCVSLETSSGTIEAERLVFGHGASLPDIKTESGTVSVPKSVVRRPQVHLLVRDTIPSRVLEAVFVCDDIIKYAHDVSRYTREWPDIKNAKKVIVVATRPCVAESDLSYDQILSKLKGCGMLGEGASLIDRRWWIAHLPPMDDDTLADLAHRFSPFIEPLRTENLGPGLGYYASRWATRLQRAGQG